MKRLHLVGKSKDGGKLVLAKTKGAKFGTFDVPITPKLVNLVRELLAEREAKKATPKESKKAATADESGTGLFQQVTGIGEDGKEPEAAQAPAPVPEPAKPRREPPRSKLSPAEIQVLLRSGRTVSAVAKMADAPAWWVQRLNDPIQQERTGAINLMLQSHLTRRRLGVSSESVGLAIFANLKERGVSFPERVIENGFSARRLDAGPWRIQLAYQYRGARRTARWSFDPETRTVEALNPLAASLSWRSSTIVPSVSAPDEDEPDAQPRRRVRRRKRAVRRPSSRRSARRTPARKRTARKKSNRKPARAKNTRAKAAGRRKRPASSSRKRAARR